MRQNTIGHHLPAPLFFRHILTGKLMRATFILSRKKNTLDGHEYLRGENRSFLNDSLCTAAFVPNKQWEALNEEQIAEGNRFLL